MPTLLRRFLRPEPTSLELGDGTGGTFRIAVKRSAAARRMTLRVSGATGRVVLTLPARARFDTARVFAEAQRDWIAVRLAALPARIVFTHGTEIPIRGETRRIVAGPSRSAPRLDISEGGDPVLVVGGAPENCPGRVRRFLHNEAGRDLRIAVDRYAMRLGVSAPRITIRDTRSRWGSCSAAGALNFSWRLIMAPPFVLDYLAAHEVAHLREMNHSDRFWGLTRELCPETDAAERWLKRHGAGLHRYG